MKKVSIIVPVYNAKEYLDDCVNSIINQTYKNIEVVLIDDGSKDSSSELCDKYAEIDCRVKVIHNSNYGVSNARNCGLKNSTGEYITFVDSDDFLDSRHIENLLSTLESNNADISMCRFRRIFPNKDIVDESVFENEIVDNTEKFMKSFLLLTPNARFGAVWRCLFKRTTVEKLYFDENLQICEDQIFIFNAIKKSSKIVCSNFVSYNYKILKNEYSPKNIVNKLRYLDLIKQIFDFDTVKSVSCLIVADLFRNEFKFQKDRTKYKINTQIIRESWAYQYYTAGQIIQYTKGKNRLKNIILWGLVKMRLV